MTELTQLERTLDTTNVGKWKAYPSYKDSGVEWLGEIPEHWRVWRLKYAAPLSTSKLDQKPLDAPYIGLENIESKTGRLLLDAPIENVDSAVGVFEKGNVLFGKLRPYLAKVACVEFSGVCTTELLVLQPAVFVSAKFLYYRLLSNNFIQLVNSMTYGTKMPRASGEQIGNLPIQLPPISEQSTITAFLDRETSKINTLVARKERLIELLQEKRAALISHVVTKGLDPDVRMRDSGVEWLGEIPAHWEVLPLKRSVKIRYGLGQPPSQLEDGIPFVRATNVKSGVIVDEGMLYVDGSGVSQDKEALLSSGEIIVVRSGAYTGDSAIVPDKYEGAIAGYDMVVAVIKGCNKYIAWQLLTEEVRGLQFNFYSLRAAQSHLNAEGLGNTLFVVPPDFEQQVIASYLDQETARIDALISKISEAIEKLKEYSAALIAAAVTGKIDVRDEVARLDD